VVDQPTLHTSGLTLRPFSVADVNDVARLVGDRDVASPTLSIPHPYGPEMAADWISIHAEAYANGEGATFAITLRHSGELVGAIGLAIRREHLRGELGYWIGKPYWGKGYCTEAVGAVMDFGFRILNLSRIHAYHFARNPASGRVLQKSGLTHEGAFASTSGDGVCPKTWSATESCVPSSSSCPISRVGRLRQPEPAGPPDDPCRSAPVSAASLARTVPAPLRRRDRTPAWGCGRPVDHPILWQDVYRKTLPVTRRHMIPITITVRNSRMEMTKR
jgi:ribosomal-protein-alanine N-acetyltransferase